MNLKGLVAIVTGGASGIGAATVKELISHECKVVIADVDDVMAQETINNIGTKNAIYIKTDVSNEISVQNLIEKTVSKFGSIHIVINSAGIIVMGYIYSSKATSKEWFNAFKINVLGTFLVSKYSSIQMTKQEYISDTKQRGVIVNIASVAGIEASKGHSIYGATKGAIIGMTLPLARDLGKFGIRVVAIAPGVIVTPMSQLLEQKGKEFIAKSTALGRLGNSEEVALAIIGACTNSYLNGEVIRVDGGIRVPHL